MNLGLHLMIALLAVAGGASDPGWGAGGRDLAGEPSLPCESWCARSEGLLLLRRAGNPGPPGTGSRSILARLAPLRRRGPERIDEILAVGRELRGDAIGHLRAILEDRVGGRALVGEPGAPVPMECRVAAALALGLSGHPGGYQGLRLNLLDPDLPEAVGAASLTGLSGSGSATDEHRFLRELALATRPLMTEAAAEALASRSGLSAAASVAVGVALAGRDRAASRGAARGLLVRVGECPKTVRDSLVRAVLSSEDPDTRAVALLALARHGDPRASALGSVWSLRGGAWAPFQVLSERILAGFWPEAPEKDGFGPLRARILQLSGSGSP